MVGAVFTHVYGRWERWRSHRNQGASNRIIFDFPMFRYGHYFRYSVDAEYDEFDPLPIVGYYDNDGIHVKINSGNVIIVQSPN